MTDTHSIEKYRADFPSLGKHRNGKPPVYFDNACTTLVPQAVIDAQTAYYTDYPGCGGARSRHWFSREVQARMAGDAESGIIGARQIIQDFINAASEKEIIFTQNTSHAINLVALGFEFLPGDRVLVTDREHNSNLVPWLRRQKKGEVEVDVLFSPPDGPFDLDRLEEKLKTGKIKLVSFGFTSNLTGYTLPAKKIIDLSHQYGAKVLLDGAQTVPHQKVDVQALDVDFLAFSIHKMCGPRGVGVLYGKKSLLETDLADPTADPAMAPVILGGGTVHDSTYEDFRLLGAPDAYEAGIQNYPGLIASGAAVTYLEQIGMGRIAEHEIMLNRFLTRELLADYGDTGWFTILGPGDTALRGGILSFEIKRPNAVGLAREMDAKNNIMVRDGLFCVHSYLNHLYGRGWTRPQMPSEQKMVYRVSLYLYNTLAECRLFLRTLNRILKNRSYID